MEMDLKSSFALVFLIGIAPFGHNSWPRYLMFIDEVLFTPKSSSLPNKRTLAARSNLPIPTVKKKLASGLVNGVMQAMPHINRRSRSNSFSKSSLSSQNLLDYKHAGIDVVGTRVRIKCLMMELIKRKGW
ncbi:hypothetical protein Tco_0413171 [Tanacetum coccineum]